MKRNFKFAHALYKARTERKLTQFQTAELLGISLRWYQYLERGTSTPSFDTLCRIIKHFNLNIAEFGSEAEYDKV